MPCGAPQENGIIGQGRIEGSKIAVQLTYWQRLRTRFQQLAEGERARVADWLDPAALQALQRGPPEGWTDALPERTRGAVLNQRWR